MRAILRDRISWDNMGPTNCTILIKTVDQTINIHNILNKLPFDGNLRIYIFKTIKNFIKLYDVVHLKFLSEFCGEFSLLLFFVCFCLVYVFYVFKEVFFNYYKIYIFFYHLFWWFFKIIQQIFSTHHHFG